MNGPFYALLTADILAGLAVLTAAAAGILVVTVKRGQAKPKP